MSVSRFMILGVLVLGTHTAFAAPVIFDQPAPVEMGTAPTPRAAASRPTPVPSSVAKPTVVNASGNANYDQPPVTQADSGRPTFSSRFTEPVTPNLQTGRFMTSGSLGFTSDSNSGLTLRLNPAIEYFFTDALSVGGKINASIQSGYNAGGFGPSATYHYWKQDRLDAYVGADVLYYRTGRLSSDRHRLYANSWTNLDVSAGLNYFVTPAVAFGPELTIGHSFGGKSGDFNTQSLLVHFALFL